MDMQKAPLHSCPVCPSGMDISGPLSLNIHQYSLTLHLIYCGVEGYDNEPQQLIYKSESKLAMVILYTCERWRTGINLGYPP